MTTEAKPGDDVTWNTSQGPTTGKVKKRLTAPMEIQGHHVAASADNPQLLVVSDASGKQAAHKPAAVKKTTKNKKR